MIRLKSKSKNTIRNYLKTVNSLFKLRIDPEAKGLNGNSTMHIRFSVFFLHFR